MTEKLTADQAPSSQGFWVLLLACLWPFLSLLQDHHGLLTFAGIARLFAVSCFLMVLAFCSLFFLQKMTKQPFQPLALGMVSFILLFFMFADFEPVVGIWKYMVLLLCLPLISGWFGRNDKFSIIFSISIVVPILYVFVIASYQVVVTRVINVDTMANGAKKGGLAEAKSVTPLLRDQASAPVLKPNVYFILVDGYPRTDIQKKIFKLDSQPLLTLMQQAGYRVQKDAKSNYVVTHVSLSSMMEADYITTDTYGPSPALSLAFYDKITGGGQVVQKFKKIGYRYYHLGGRVYSISACSDHADECLNQSMPLLKFMDIALLKKTPLQIWMKEILAFSGSDRPTNLEDLMMALDDLKRDKDTEPFFLFAHTIPPHAPYLYTKSCEERDEKLSLFESLNTDTMAPYREGIICVNQQLERLVNKISKQDPTAIVVIQSDHGSHFNVNWFAKLDEWSDLALQERFSILSAIKAPKTCQSMLFDDWVAVNTFRFVFACLTQTEPRYLDPAFYTTTYAIDAVDHGKVFRYDAIPAERSNQ